LDLVFELGSKILQFGKKKIALTKIASLKIWRTKLKSTSGESMKIDLSNPILVYNVKTAMKGSFQKGRTKQH
jgi:hypothetical protein